MAKQITPTIPNLVRAGLAEFGIHPHSYSNTKHTITRTRKWVGGMGDLTDKEREAIISHVKQLLFSRGFDYKVVEFHHHIHIYALRTYWSFRIKTDVD